MNHTPHPAGAPAKLPEAAGAGSGAGAGAGRGPGPAGPPAAAAAAAGRQARFAAELELLRGAKAGAEAQVRFFTLFFRFTKTLKNLFLRFTRTLKNLFLGLPKP